MLDVRRRRTTKFWPRSFVEGREFTCGVLGEEALPIVEIVANRDEFYTLRREVRRGRQHAHRAGDDR